MAKRTKQKPLPPVSLARQAIFDAYDVCLEAQISLHQQLCTFTPERKQELAQLHEMPYDGDDEGWGNRILENAQKNRIKFVAAIDKMMGQYSQIKQFEKAVSLGMDRKEAVEKYLGDVPEAA